MVQLNCIETSCSFKTQDLPFDQAQRLLDLHIRRHHPVSSDDIGKNHSRNEESKVIQLSCTHCSYKTQPLPDGQAQIMLRKHVDRSHRLESAVENKARAHPGNEVMDRSPLGDTNNDIDSSNPSGANVRNRVNSVRGDDNTDSTAAASTTETYQHGNSDRPNESLTNDTSVLNTG